VDIEGQIDASSKDKARITLSTQVPVVTLRYTTDGSTPGAASPVYRQPIELALPVTVTAIPFTADGQPLAEARKQRIDRSSLASFDSAHLAGCPHGDLGLRVPLLPDATAPAPVYNVDLMNACWQVRNVRLDGIESVVIDGAWLARNYGLAHDAIKVVARASRTANGEFEIHLDRCDGPLLASLPLPGKAEPGTPFRATSALSAHAGVHDLCVLSTAPVHGALAAPGRMSFGARPTSPETL
jgi:hexosaminidase